jgi:hypothetical protein
MRIKDLRKKKGSDGIAGRHCGCIAPLAPYVEEFPATVIGTTCTKIEAWQCSKCGRWYGSALLETLWRPGFVDKWPHNLGEVTLDELSEIVGTIKETYKD